MTRILAVLNDYDPITHYMFEWSRPILNRAKKKGIKVDQIGPIVNKSEIESRIKKTNPDFIFLNGHGTCDMFCGHEDKPVITSDNRNLLKNKIAFARSCNCAEVLGKEAVNKDNCKSFIGYELEFANVRQNNKELTPLEDEVSRPIWESSNSVPLGLIKGSSVDIAVVSSHRSSEKEMIKLLTSKEIWATTVLKALIQNDAGLTYHGDGSARIIN